MQNYKIIIEYDGSNFVGWQRQDNGISIQQLVEEAIQKLSKQKIILLMIIDILKQIYPPNQLVVLFLIFRQH